MKNSLYIFIFFLLSTIISCDQYVNEDINRDPNNPVEVPIQNMIPSIQVQIADLYGGEFSRVNCSMIQHVEGIARKGSKIYTYAYILSERSGISWTKLYNSILNETRIARQLAIEQNLHTYLAIVNILEAQGLMMATDLWDDIPYTEAFQGIQNLHPRFDSQSDIYDIIFQLLEESENLIISNSGSILPGIDDMIYEGNMDTWLKTLYGLRARALMRFKNYTGALEAARVSFSSQEENFTFDYPGGEDTSPWFRFNRDRTGDIEISETMRSKMESYDDPRINLFNHTFDANHPFLTDDMGVEIMTYREMQFIIAECDWRINGRLTDEGYQAFKEGIRSSFEILNYGNNVAEEYLNNPLVDPGQENIGIDKIMDQKYFALFLNPECYTDYRRTDLPFLWPTAGTNIPVRWDYPLAEYQFNENAPEAGSIDIFTNKVFWDLD